MALPKPFFFLNQTIFASHINQTSLPWPPETNLKINMLRSRNPWHHRQLTLLKIYRHDFFSDQTLKVQDSNVMINVFDPKD